MPQVKITDEARIDLKRFTDFLIENGASDKAQEVVSTIIQSIKTLASNPHIGRKYELLEGLDYYRELVIRFGRSGYVALYSVHENEDLVVVHAVRHQKEVGYE